MSLTPSAGRGPLIWVILRFLRTRKAASIALQMGLKIVKSSALSSFN